MKIILKTSDKKFLFLKLLLIGLILYIFTVSLIFPFKWFQNLTGGPVCLFKRFADQPCLFCGLTTSLLNSFRLNLKEAFLQHPGGVFIFLVFIGICLNIILEISIKKRISISLTKNEKFILSFGTIALLLTNWVYKVLKGVL